MPSSESKLNEIPGTELKIMISGMFKGTSKQLKKIRRVIDDMKEEFN